MTRDELIQRLNGYEWNDTEFKLARREVPKSAYETVSAFCNTAGGWLVFGIEERDGSFTIMGVNEVDKVQNDFLSGLRGGSKLNRPVRVQEQLLIEDSRPVLVFYISEARRQDKPVYLNGDIRQTFVRRGGADERCNQTDIQRFLREASNERFDGQPVDFDPEHCFAQESLHWYRQTFSPRNPAADPSMSDLEFLDHWGFLVDRGGSLLPSRAAVLLFGMDSAFRQVLPRPVIDCQKLDANLIDGSDDHRWSDRLVIEQNLIESWRSVIDWYMKHAERPFRIDPATLQREDAPAEYIAFREAIINLLIHQDYSDEGRKPVLQVFRDNTRFWNPGESFASADELLDPGEKEVRNPRIVNAFRRIGLSEQAGTGMRAIFRSWQQLGHVPPVIRNEKERHAFELLLPRESLLSEEQLLFQARLGVRLTEADAKVFAYACREGGLRVQDVKMVANVSVRDAAAILERLRVQALITPVDGSGNYFLIAEHLRPGLAARESATDQPLAGAQNLVSDQPARTPPSSVTDQPQRLTALSETQWKIVALCDVPQAMAALMDRLGLTHRTFFRRTHLDPLVRGGVLKLTHPEQPNHPNQAYVLTDVGVEIKARRILNESLKQE